MDHFERIHKIESALCELTGKQVFDLFTEWDGTELLDEGFYKYLVDEGILPEEDEEEEEEQKMQKYELFIGCNVNGKPEYTVDYVRFACKQALEVLGFSGATFTEAVGLWEGVEESTVICMICTDKPYSEVYNLASWIKQHLRQESVMVVESGPKISFV